MKDFVIAQYDMFNGRMIMTKCKAESKLQALTKFLTSEEVEFESVSEAEDYAFNCDMSTSIIEI